ncbi:MAG TPA: glycosyltransferase family 2 protein [Terriglobales bacterium]|nr:glycosyltransferase family 2 protein [Terriglobales bacterium]
MLSLLKLVFWASAGFIFYVYAGYPLVVWLLRTLFPCRLRKGSVEPFVSLVVAAYNEENVIERKLRNALELDYSPGRLEVVVVSDGSTDSTAKIVDSFIAAEGKGRVRLFALSENHGKVAALNSVIPQLRGEIVVFSDASSILDPGAVRALISNFADPRVGAASGVYRVVKHDSSHTGGQEDFYWKYETFLKNQEAKLGCLMGAHGSLYAIRRDLYCFPHERTINDDFVIPAAVLPRGYIIAYEPTAVAYEEAHEMDGFSRRVRITAGNVEQLAAVPRLLSRPLTLFCFLSHKGGRLLVPIAMVSLAVTSWWLRRLPLYQTAGMAQIAFYSLALLGALLPLPRVVGLPYYFCKVNSALFAWIYHGLRLGRVIPSRRELDRLGQRHSAIQP